MKPTPDSLKLVFEYIDENKTQFINNLETVVAIPSVSALPENRKDVVKMMQWAADKLTSLNAQVEMCDIGVQKIPSGVINLPPVILASLGNDSRKPTLCVYGHLDVQPAAISDGWDTDPFKLTLKNDKLYGRGSTDDKGPAISWLHVVEAYQKTNTELPVNLKFCYEGMEESDSQGLDELLISKKDIFFRDVDYICISDNYWLGLNKPCLAYGLRGLCYFFVEVTCSSKDLHSGIYGGTINEAMSDLIAILDTLVDKDGKILVSGVMDDVEPLTEDEKQTYAPIDFDVNAFKDEIGANQLIHDKKEEVLMARWRYPSLSIHGIEGAFSEPGCKTVIPKKVIGKFSIRLVPNQDPKKIEALVREHIKKQWKIRGSANSINVELHGGSFAWKSDPNHPHYVAAKNATQMVYNVAPDLIREGGSIPVALTFQDIIGKNVLLMPMGSCDDGAHSQNEKINVSNYIIGTKQMASYLNEVGKLPKVSS